MDIFVAKLSSETKAENLTELFSQYGSVSSSKVIMDRNTGMSKCYGFVEMKNESEAANAIELLNDSKFMGKYILVKKSEPRPQENRPSNQRSDSRPTFRKREYGSNDNRKTDRERNFNRYD